MKTSTKAVIIGIAVIIALLILAHQLEEYEITETYPEGWARYRPYMPVGAILEIVCKICFIIFSAIGIYLWWVKSKVETIIGATLVVSVIGGTTFMCYYIIDPFCLIFITAAFIIAINLFVIGLAKRLREH
ncbi:MAG: hypothetical protein AB1485_04285 [Candidatus Thermoplasmatota archaeon]